MNKYNVTAQIYNKCDKTKQTILTNEIICAESSDKAKKIFETNYSIDHSIVKIHSSELIN